MAEILKLSILLLALLAMLGAFAVYSYRYYQDCGERGGAVVRGAFGWACVAGPSRTPHTR